MGVLRTLMRRYPPLIEATKKIRLIIDAYTVFPSRQIRYIKPNRKPAHPKTILFYPEWPYQCYTIYKICYYNRYNMTVKPGHKGDAVVFFEDSTHRVPDAVLAAIHEKRPVINYHSRDISKKKVDDTQKKVFGYSLAVNPWTYKGMYVKKSDKNSLHNYLVCNVPEKPQKGFVYQMIVNNTDGDTVVDIRLPVFGNIIPVAFLKYRSVRTRFEADNMSAKLMKTKDVITPVEYKKIVQFCRYMGLDCGELDVLRDTKTKKLYVVDVNNTPGGPPLELTHDELQEAVERMAAAFEEAFMKSI